jgi:5-methylcytosine-specific restriction endonuclease McrA
MKKSRYSVSRKGYSHKGTEKHKCKKCDQDNPDEFYGKKKTECKKCFNRRSVERRREWKRRAVNLLGGECVRCGYSRYVGALEFHHKDPSQKDVTVSASGKAWDVIKEEVLKCDLLCSNCHREVHDELRKT